MYFCSKTELRRWTAAEGVTVHATGFDSLGNLDMDPRDGTLVVTDAGANQVFRLLPGGGRELVAGDGSANHHGSGGPATNAGLDQVRGIAFLPHGGMFLATQGDGDIWYVDTNHIAHEFIAGSGNSVPMPTDEIAEPRGISLAPSGDLLITENDYAVVRVVPRQTAFCGAIPTGNVLQLDWSSMPGHIYRIDRIPDLTATATVTVAALPAASHAVVTRCTVTNPPGTSAAFYRLAAQPDP